MKNMRSVLAAWLTILAASGWLATGALLAQPGNACHPVHANIASTFFAEGCTSPVGLCTAGEITQAGFLNGSTTFVALGVAPAAGMPGEEPLSTLSYTGLLTLTTMHGTLTIDDVGIFDTALGVFSEVDRVVEGTDELAGASGVLFISGYATPDGTGFTGAITGEVCFAE